MLLKEQVTTIYNTYSQSIINPFILKIFMPGDLLDMGLLDKNTFENNLGSRHLLEKIKVSCLLVTNQHYSLKYVLKITLVGDISLK